MTHQCDEACGIYYDPCCPLWGKPDGHPWRAETVAGLVATFQSRVYRNMLRAMFTEMLKPIVDELVTQAINDSETRRRREALDLKAHLAHAGIKLESKAGKLMASPAEMVTAEVKRAIAAYRSLLVET